MFLTTAILEEDMVHALHAHAELMPVPASQHCHTTNMSSTGDMPYYEEKPREPCGVVCTWADRIGRVSVGKERCCKQLLRSMRCTEPSSNKMRRSERAARFHAMCKGRCASWDSAILPMRHTLRQQNVCATRMP